MDRKTIPIIDEFVDLKKELTPTAQLVYKGIKEHYEADNGINEVDLQLFEDKLCRRNRRHKEKIQEFIKRAAGDSSSPTHVRSHILETKVAILEESLGARMINFAPYKEIENDIKTLISLGEKGLEAEELNTHEYELYNGKDFLKLGQKAIHDDKIQLYPSSINTYLGGGVWRQASIVVFGRPDMGKTTFMVNLSCGFIDKGRKVLYLANEDPASQLLIRHLQCFRGIKKDVVEAEMEPSIKACQTALNNLTIIETPAGTMGHLKRIVESVNPDVLIVDQLRNIRSEQESRVLQLEEVQREIRGLGKEFDAVTVSVTQAGASAEHKPVLDMTDIDFSKTGIAGACDLMIGIGATEDMIMYGQRMLSTPKNKISGVKEPFSVTFKTDICRVL